MPQSVKCLIMKRLGVVNTSTCSRCLFIHISRRKNCSGAVSGKHWLQRTADAREHSDPSVLRSIWPSAAQMTMNSCRVSTIRACGQHAPGQRDHVDPQQQKVMEMHHVRGQQPQEFGV